MAAICGIDWADQWHDVRIADEAGAALAQREAGDDQGAAQLAGRVEAGAGGDDRRAHRATFRSRRWLFSEVGKLSV